MLDAEVYLHLDMPGRYVNGWMGKVGLISISFYVLSELQGMTMNLLVAANRKRICLQRRFHLILHYPALRRQCGRPVFLGPEEKGGLVYGQRKKFTNR